MYILYNNFVTFNFSTYKRIKTHSPIIFYFSSLLHFESFIYDSPLHRVDLPLDQQNWKCPENIQQNRRRGSNASNANSLESLENSSDPNATPDATTLILWRNAVKTRNPVERVCKCEPRWNFHVAAHRSVRGGGRKGGEGKPCNLDATPR